MFRSAVSLVLGSLAATDNAKRLPEKCNAGELPSAKSSGSVLRTRSPDAEA